MIKQAYKITGMTCGSCAMSIENAIKEIPAVNKSHVDFTKNQLTIESAEKIDNELIRNEVTKLGNYTISVTNDEEPPVSPQKQSKQSSIFLWGAMGTIGIALIFYLVQVLGMQSWKAPFNFLANQWYFVIPLIIAFGVQLGLFRAIHLKAKRGGGATMAASGGLSTTSMLACCMHNIVILFPIVGLTGLATLLSTYQDYVFLISILIAGVSILFMWNKYQLVHKECHISS